MHGHVTELTNATRQLEAHLASVGDSACIASLPLLVEEIAADESHGDRQLEAALVYALRRRVGLHA